MSIAATLVAIEAMPQTAQRNGPVLILIATIALYIALPQCAGVRVARGRPMEARARALRVIEHSFPELI